MNMLIEIKKKYPDFPLEEHIARLQLKWHKSKVLYFAGEAKKGQTFTVT